MKWLSTMGGGRLQFSYDGWTQGCLRQRKANNRVFQTRLNRKIWHDTDDDDWHQVAAAAFIGFDWTAALPYSYMARASATITRIHAMAYMNMKMNSLRVLFLSTSLEHGTHVWKSIEFCYADRAWTVSKWIQLLWLIGVKRLVVSLKTLGYVISLNRNSYNDDIVEIYLMPMNNFTLFFNCFLNYVQSLPKLCIHFFLIKTVDEK